MTEVNLAHLALVDLPVPTIVVNLSGHVLYANRMGQRAFGLSSSVTSIERWQPEGRELVDQLELMGASSNWQPLRLHCGDRPLHCQARGVMSAGLDEPCVAITLAPNAAKPFKDHARQIRQLNEQLAAHRVTEAELRRAMDVSALLQRELVHRVKNNLTVMSALLRSEAKSADSPAISTVLNEAAGRIMSISTVHEMLDATGSLSEVETGELLAHLIGRISSSFCPKNIDIEADLEGARAHIDIGLPLALLVNELVTNAIKHAFSGRTVGCISIGMRKLGSDLELQVSDNGVGMPTKEDGEPVTPRIVYALARQLNANIECRVEGGTHWRFLFPDGRDVDMSSRP